MSMSATRSDRMIVFLSTGDVICAMAAVGLAWCWILPPDPLTTVIQCTWAVCFLTTCIRTGTANPVWWRASVALGIKAAMSVGLVLAAVLALGNLLVVQRHLRDRNYVGAAKDVAGAALGALLLAWLWRRAHSTMPQKHSPV